MNGPGSVIPIRPTTNAGVERPKDEFSKYEYRPPVETTAERVPDYTKKALKLDRSGSRDLRKEY